jgi:energy-coupling factor transport system permease protein
LSPGIHLLIYVFFAGAVFLSGSIKFHIIIASCVLFALFFMPLKKIMGGFIPIFLFLGFTFISNLFGQAGMVIAVAGPVTITDEGLRIASIRMLRVFDMVYAAKILTHTTSLETLLGSLKKVLRPLERIGLPVHEFFSVMTLTLQCFPVLKQRLYDRYSEKSGHQFPGSAAAPGTKNTMSNLRTVAALIGSMMVPLFVESMVEPEKFFTTTTQTGDRRCGDEKLRS